MRTNDCYFNHLVRGCVDQFFDMTFAPPPPDEPTGAQPGSPDKVRVLAKRLELGVDLWHPSDAGHEGCKGHPSVAGSPFKEFRTKGNDRKKIAG